MTLMKLAQAGVSVAMLGFVLSSMLGMGLGLRVGQIVAPLRNARLVVLSLVANFVLMPLAAVALARMLRLDEPLGVGLLLLGAAAGAPFLPKLAQIAKGNLAFAVGLMVLLMVITVAYLPLVLPLLLEGVSVNPAKNRPLAVSADAPAAGRRAGGERQVPGRGRARKTSARQDFQLEPHRADPLADDGERQKRPGCVRDARHSGRAAFLAAGYGIGWVLGGPGADTRPVLGLGTAQRNIAAALVVGSQSFDDPKVVVMVVVVAIVGLLTLMPLSRLLAKS